MLVNVQMSEHEFQEFMAWRKDLAAYKAELVGMRSKYSGILNKVLFAIETDPKKPGKCKIADQEHAAELLDWVIDLSEKLEV